MPSDFLARFIIQHRILCVILVLFISVMLMAGLKHFKVTSDQRIFYSSNDETFQALEFIDKTYSSDRTLIIALQPQRGDVFQTPVLSLVEEITEFGWQIPHSLRVDSITNYIHTQAEDDLIISEPLVESSQDLTPESLNRIRDFSLAETNIINKLISKDGNFTAIVVSFAFPDRDADKARTEAMEEVEQALSKWREANPNITIKISGNVVIGAALPKLVRQDGATVMVTGAAIMLAVLLLLVHPISAVLAMITCWMAALSGLGAALWNGSVITSVSINAPIIVSILGLADCIHIAISYRDQYSAGHSKTQAMINSLSINLKPIFLTSITTAISFFALNFSKSAPYHDLGNAVGVGILIAMLASLFLFAPLLSFFPVKAKTVSKLVNMKRYSDFLDKRKNSLIWGWGIVALILLAALPLNRLDDSILNFFSEDLPIRQDSNWISEHLGGPSVISVSVAAQSDSSITEPEYLGIIDRFNDFLQNQEEVRYSETIVDILKNLNQVMHGDDPEWRQVPDSRELASQYLLLYEMSLPAGFNLNHLITPDHTESRVIINLRSLSVEETMAWEEKIQDWFANNATQLEQPIIGGSGLAFAHLQHRNISSLTFGFVVSLVFIALMLIWALKSFKLGVISLIPNLLPAGMAFGIWAMMSGQIGMGISIGFTMTLGIVVDDSIHLMSKFQHGRTQLNLSAKEAVHYALSQVGAAMVVTTLIIVAGFSAILGSSFTPNQDVATITILTVSLAALIDLILLPAILLKLAPEAKVNH